MITAQGKHPEVKKLLSQVVPTDEVDRVSMCFFVRDGLLLRKWVSPIARSDHPLAVKPRILTPRSLCASILELAHENPLSGHLGTRKTRGCILEHSWWPVITSSVTNYVRTCHACQKVGKPNQRPPKYPLKPVPVMDESFTEFAG